MKICIPLIMPYRHQRKRGLWLRILLLLAIAIPPSPLYSQAQNTVLVKGVVTTDTGDPLPGAAVAIKGSSQGVACGPDGSFQIQVPANTVLRITYIGYLLREVKVGTGPSENLRIQLSPDKSDLNEVIVVGYGKQKKSDITGSIVSISERALKDVPVSNISQALQGQAAGIDVQKSGGNNKPGASPKILIRGSRSVNASNDPLFVVDGIPYNGNINDLNQDDVTSVEILKDASATAIYGSRGANGVILISTRRGKTGKPVVSYSGYGGFVKNRGKFPIMNGEEFATFKKWAKINGTPGKYTGLDDPRLNSPGEEFTPTEVTSMETGRSTDWQDLIYKTGMMTNHQLGVTGGSEQTQYAASAGYFKETGIYPGQSFERFSLKLSVDQQLSNRIRAGVSSLNTLSTTNGENANPMGQALRANPLAVPYDSAGNLVGFVEGNANQVWNPLANFVKGASVENRKRFSTFSTLYLEAELARGLKYKFNAGAEVRSDVYGNFYASATTNNLGSPSKSSNRTRYSTNFTLENLLTYDRVFAEKHRLNFTGMYSWQQSSFQDNNFSNNTLPADYMEYFGPQFGANLTGTGNQERWDIISYMARVNYGFDDRYLLTLTMRSDGSSRLAPGNKFQVFPSVAVAWNIAQESFLKGNSTLSQLKLRATYGRTGNTAIDPYQTLGSLTDVKYNYGQNTMVIGAYLANIPNPSLTWEYTSTVNGGLDFGFLNNRISGSLEVYKQFTNSLLLPQSLPPTSGIPNSILTNVGKTENFGIELQVSTNNIIPKNRNSFGWTTDLNFFLNRGKITQLANGVLMDATNNWYVGQPIGTIYDLKKIGIWQNTAADSALAKALGQTLGTGNNSVIGNIKVEDVNGDKKLNANDRIFLGSGQPDWEGGMTNRFTYAGFDLTVVAFARMGSTLISNMHRSGGSFTNTYQANYNNLKTDYWTPTNGQNFYPKPNAGSTNTPNANLLSYYDGSYLKIRSIGLGYNVAPAVIRKLGLSSLRVYSTVEEPFILFSPYVNKYGGLDPESAGSLAVDTPPTWSMIFGLNVTF